jgi:hypothetical protein
MNKKIKLVFKGMTLRGFIKTWRDTGAFMLLPYAIIVYIWIDFNYMVESIFGMAMALSAVSYIDEFLRQKEIDRDVRKKIAELKVEAPEVLDAIIKAYGLPKKYMKEVEHGKE